MNSHFHLLLHRFKQAIKIVEKNPKKRGGLSLSKRFAMAQETTSFTNPHLEKIKREIAILKKCRHPNIVLLKEVIDDPRSDKIYLVLEYLTGGEVRWRDELSETPGPVLSMETSRKIFRDLVSGLSYCNL